ncbi:MAG: hypothetical protein U0228_05790 [Myxococcaceae bacterium]
MRPRRGDPVDALAWSNRRLPPPATLARRSSPARLCGSSSAPRALSQLKRAWELGDTNSVALGLAVAKKKGCSIG